jgi:hypothetical protein
MIPRRAPLAGLIVGLAIGAWADSDVGADSSASAAQMPAGLSDEEFWRLTEQLSEPNGFFRSDNLVSDEMLYRDAVPSLASVGLRYGVYLGVGPEQNFTYIAALEPRMAFVLDIRRGNLHLQLMYKALFELSADRAEFISKLFTKPRPAGLSTKSTAAELIKAYWDPSAKTSPEAVYKENLRAIQDHLTKTRNLPLGKEDLDGIEYVYFNFYWHGPAITWGSSSGSGTRGLPNFGDLMLQTDAQRRELSFLASEASFKVVKELQARNLIVPVVGNFAGPKALRAIGDYVRSRKAVITAFYVSEVEPYLQESKQMPAFCANMATLPVSPSSVLVRPPTVSITSAGASFATYPISPTPVLVPIAPEVKNCAVRSVGLGTAGTAGS